MNLLKKRILKVKSGQVWMRYVTLLTKLKKIVVSTTSPLPSLVRFNCVSLSVLAKLQPSILNFKNSQA